ncbi:MAG: PPC domain-containing protein [Verrucomicrobiales bacterium]|nr:PPC domain-containing protein [Verrucomicrobiales bacterium]
MPFSSQLPGGPKVRRRLRIAALWAWLGATGLHAAVPVLDHVFPAAVQIGTTNSVTLVGKFDPWPPELWTDLQGVRFEATTNQGVVTVVVATNATPGPGLVRAHTAEGVSAPRFLIISPSPQTSEVEPNGERTAPELLGALPAEVNGRLEKNGDVDGYGVALQAGETLVAWLEAYQLMSPLDPVLRLVDARGVQRAWNHDDGRTLDPLLAWTAPEAGTYVLQVFAFPHPADSSIQFSGNARGVYRLHVTTGPVVRFTVPLGGRPSEGAGPELRGWNLSGAGSPSVGPGESRLRASGRDLVFLPGAEAALPDPAQPLVPAGMEVEPNDTGATATPIPVPGTMTGNLDRAGDVDRFRFEAKKGEPLILEVQSASLGFSLDAWLAVEEVGGKRLVRKDDAVGSDPRLEWSAPEDGTYIATVGNLLQRGGEDQWYRLGVTRPRPTLKPTVAENAFTANAGTTNEIKVALARSGGFNAPLVVSVQGLPDSVTCEPVPVKDTAAEAILRLVVREGAAPYRGSFRIKAAEESGGGTHPVSMDLISTGENNGVPQGFRHLVVESIRDFWLTIPPPPPPPAPKPEEKKP